MIASLGGVAKDSFVGWSAWKLFLLVVGLEAVGLYAVGLEVVDSAVLAFRRWQ